MTPYLAIATQFFPFMAITAAPLYSIISDIFANLSNYTCIRNCNFRMGNLHHDIPFNTLLTLICSHEEDLGKREVFQSRRLFRAESQNRGSFLFHSKTHSERFHVIERENCVLLSR